MEIVNVPFNELLSFVVDNRGKTCPTAETGIPLIATNCISNQTLYPTKENVRYVDKNTYDTWFRAHPQPNDIIFVLKGSPGRCALTPNPVDFCIAQDMVAIRPDKQKIEPNYLFAALRSPFIQDAIERMHVGTMIPHFKKGDFSKLLIPIPDKKIQKSIGDIYIKFEQKIDLNRRTNETLEAMARALFRDWFVDFGPTRAKMAGEAPYLAPELWELFPDRLDDEGKPEGWHISPIGDETDIVGGSTPSTSNSIFWNGNHYWATPKDLSGLNSPVLSDTSRKITDEGLTQISSGLLPSGSVLLSSRAPVGYTAITTVPLAINQGFIGVKCTQSLSAPYVLLWMKESMELILQNANGSTFQEISKKNFRPLPIIKASHDLLKAFDTQSQGIFDKIIVSDAESRTLTQLRDLLLPKLMSGEISIRDAEKMVEDAA
ncbi:MULTISPECIES: restriction endonuclease subunit S [Acetobacter]|uniref:Type I site-specific deoxyribonuclease n=1 Tax=Acetobacter ascendens TaxID=481146 RepID=A0A1Y0V1X2_9PROT|nr:MULTISPECIES: restriction endonuclease subunit S [Acetobacter]ARW12071.1 Type I site-specific deoxyribonuclease [Acetobacter ascendens]KAA8384826.1 restriction endonuclease subunit S [Acetobacter sp. DmW_136]